MKRIVLFFTALILFLSLTSCRKNEGIELLDSKSMILYVGQTGTFDEGYEYSTNDVEIIQINGNQYRTLKEGSATVTVREGENKIGVYIIAVYGVETVELKDLKLVNAPSHLENKQKIKLQYELDPVGANDYAAIVWESLNPDVATIDRFGNVEVLKTGEVTFTLSAIDTQIKKEFKFEVLPRETVFKTSHPKLLGIVGETQKILSVNVVTDYSFDGNVTWFTEDSSIVNITQDGTTSFLKPGTTNVGIKGIVNGQELTYKTNVVVTEDMGYQIIRTPQQLQDIENTSGYYMLGNDIDMKEAVSEGGALYDDGRGFMPLFENAENAFKGEFNGNGFTIYNMYINRPDDVFVAFMRYISAEEGKEGIIKNLSFVGGEISGGNYTSVFYSNASGYGSVDSGLRDCYVEMSLKSTGSLSCLVGNNKGLVENCIVNVEYEAEDTVYQYALNHTGLEKGLGIRNCVYIGETDAKSANLSNGGFVARCTKITKDEIATHTFKMGDNWTWEQGQLPKVKGVTYE
jgi:hypothetical protein